MDEPSSRPPAGTEAPLPDGGLAPLAPRRATARERLDDALGPQLAQKLVSALAPRARLDERRAA